MPAVKAGVPGAGEQLVHIDELGAWAQLAFEGYKCAPAMLQLGLVNDSSVALYWKFAKASYLSSHALAICAQLMCADMQDPQPHPEPDLPHSLQQQ